MASESRAARVPGPVALLRRAARAWLRVTEVMALISAAIVLGLAFPIGFDAVARKAHHPTIWAFDVGLYLMTTCAYLATAHAIETGNHFRVTLLLEYLPRAIRRVLEVMDLLIVIGFGAVMAYAGWDFMHTSLSNGLRSTTLLEVPLWIPETALPVAGTAICLEGLALLVELVSGREEVIELKVTDV